MSEKLTTREKKFIKITLNGWLESAKDILKNDKHETIQRDALEKEVALIISIKRKLK